MVWNFEEKVYCWAGVPSAISMYYSISYSGDTLINSFSYHKLTIPFFQTPFSACGPSTILSNIYKGAIRKDTVLNKVFIVPPSDTAEQLLYDFTLQVGDTIKGYLEQFAVPIDTVETIDSVLVGNSYRKRWNVNLGYNIEIIEGVGSTYGLVEQSPGNNVDWSEFTLTCFKQDGQPLFPSTTTNCLLISNLDETNLKVIQIKVFPNPSLGTFVIENNGNEIKDVRITDRLGIIVFEQYDFFQSLINVEKLTSGIYFLSVVIGDERKMIKIIISH